MPNRRAPRKRPSPPPGGVISTCAITFPSPPTNPPASPYLWQVTQGQSNGGPVVSVTWFDNSSDESSFHLERKTGSGSFQEIAVLAADSTSYSDSSVSTGVTYTYRVRACNAAGCSRLERCQAFRSQGWIEGQLVITSVEAGATHGIEAGDRVLTINGRPVAAALAEIESLTSAVTPQWRLLRSLAELAGGKPGGTATLTVQPHAGGPVRTVTVAYTAPFGSSLGIGGFGSPTDPRPEKIAELRPGIFYVDLTRISDDDFNAAVDQLAAADGVVFDMRGYPFSLFSDSVLRHLIDKPVTSNWFNIPIVTRPDRQGWRWDSQYGFITPAAPRLTGRIAFLVDGRVLSAAETLMGIVEGEHLGALVGGTTAGTNGGMNPFDVAGGHTLRWTGMDIRKKDGSPHHGVGIKPTVPVSRTLAGVIAGRDELLEKGIEVVS